jgi:hypothetical protein
LEPELVELIPPKGGRICQDDYRVRTPLDQGKTGSGESFQ